MPSSYSLLRNFSTNLGDILKKISPNPIFTIQFLELFTRLLRQSLQG